MTTKLLVIHPWVAAYRVPFYDRLEKVLAQHDIQLMVTRNCAPPSMAGRADMSGGPWARNIPTSWLTFGGREIASRRIGSIMREFQPDLVVVEQALHNRETYLLLLRHSAGRYGMATWGHGRSYSSEQSASVAALKNWLTRRGDWFFAYTQGGADQVVQHGFPRARVSVLNNTIDTERLRADLDVVEPDELDEFRRAQGLTPGRTALFLGGVDEKKGIGFLLESAKLVRGMMPGFVLLIAGSGDSVPMVRAAQADGVPVRLLGRTDGLAKALALSAADVLAIPEQVGLVAVDALVSGRPIITTDHPMHGPEFDYLVPGETTIVTTHVFADYAHALVSALSAPDRLADMQAAARRASYQYTLDGMVESFVEGVLAWRDLRRAGLTSGTRPLGNAADVATHPRSERPLLAVLMTCHNRQELTLRCLGALRSQDLPNVDLRVYLTDDGSTDGTGAAISTVDLPIRVVAGGGELYWAAGMAMAERAAMGEDPDLLLWLNDDVTLDPDGLAALMAVHEQAPEAIVVGTVRDPDTSEQTYGGRNRRGRHPQRFSSVPQADHIQRASAFNGNVVLIPRSARNIVGPIDGSFAHAYADDDYSLRTSQLGVPIICAAGTVGICSPNPAGTAPDSMRLAWMQLQGPKGLPWRSQVRYLRRHGGLLWPAYLAWGYGKAMTRASVRRDGSTSQTLPAPDSRGSSGTTE
jgi:GT2 family glycosyltransferase/glycosyltransferase involved in cell wall biosynthesis